MMIAKILSRICKPALLLSQIILILALGATLLPAAEISLAPEKSSTAIQDRQDFQTPDRPAE